MVVRVLPSKTLVAWCRSCKVYCNERDAGTRCPSIDCDHRLCLRLGYICPECECQNIFFTRKEFMEHQCEDYGP